MTIMVKTPGKPVELRQNITSPAIEIDAGQINFKNIGNGIVMIFDSYGFIKNLPRTLADGYTGEYFYGDIAFAAFDKKRYFRSLTPKQQKIVERFVGEHTLDKRK